MVAAERAQPRSAGRTPAFTPVGFVLSIAVMGSTDARKLRGEPDSASERLGRELLVLLGVLGMLFFGAIIGGLIAFAVVALTAFSERAPAQASPTDRGIARILLFIVPIAMWLFLFPLLALNVDIRIGG